MATDDGVPLPTGRGVSSIRVPSAGPLTWENSAGATPVRSGRFDDGLMTALGMQDEATEGGGGGGGGDDATALPVPRPISIRELRAARAEKSATGSGSIISRTAELREQAHKQMVSDLGFDPELERHAWQTTGLHALREMNHPFVAAMDRHRASEHADECPLCQFLIKVATPEELQNVNWQDPVAGLSALLAECSGTVAREQMIITICEYYETELRGSMRAQGVSIPPLTRETCREHMQYVVLPAVERQESVQVLREAEQFLRHSCVSYNAVTRTCKPDIRALNALVKIVTAKDMLMRSLEKATELAALQPRATAGTPTGDGAPSSSGSAAPVWRTWQRNPMDRRRGASSPGASTSTSFPGSR